MIDKNLELGNTVPGDTGRSEITATAGKIPPAHPTTSEPPEITARCLFAARQILPKTEAFLKEIEGAKAGEDIEYIHRIRVASRRLRAALPLFSYCCPEKKYQKWTREIKNITRTLGEARDLDVQLEFLRKYQKRIAKRRKKTQQIQGEPETPVEMAIGFLSGGLQARRASIQKNVISSLSNFEKQHIIEDLQSAINQRLIPPGKSGRTPLLRGVSPLAADQIGNAIYSLRSHEPWVRFPEAVAEHHAMRIAAKKLRYTLELYAPLYRLGLKKHTRRVAKLQQVLGDLHDCDVWIDKVTRIVLKERLKERKPADLERPSPVTVEGLTLFRYNRERERKAIYHRFVRYWSSLQNSGFFEELKRDILLARKTEYRHRDGTSDEETRAAVYDLAMSYPGGISHAKHVTSLALLLFDELKPLHQLGERDRFLLECGGLLHEIGLKYGKSGHQPKSAGMIFSGYDLPFDLYELGCISLMALWHKGAVQPELSGYYQVFSPVQQKNARALATLLRVADGLDCTRNSAVISVSCTITPGNVACTVTPSTGVGKEKEKAILKADQFELVFGKPIVFQ